MTALYEITHADDPPLLRPGEQSHLAGVAFFFLSKSSSSKSVSSSDILASMIFFFFLLEWIACCVYVGELCRENSIVIEKDDSI